MLKAGVVLSGCGVQDGSEIHEAVLTLLTLDRLGVQTHCLAPDIVQSTVVDHEKGEEMVGESRKVITESSRISRGKINNLGSVKESMLDMLIFPGGFGAALNLSDFAGSGADCHVDLHVARLISDMHYAGKPIGAWCIAPVLVANVLGKGGHRPQLTIGMDHDTAMAIETMGGEHVRCITTDVVVDTRNKLVSTPAYMLADKISDVAEGIEKACTKLVGLAER